MNEKHVLKEIADGNIDHTFMIHCYETLADRKSLYFVLDFVPGGELRTYVKSKMGAEPDV